MLNATVVLNNGVKMPILGYGTYKLTGKQAYNSVITAIKQGYRHIDTAKYYENEKEVGEAIRDCGVPRNEIFVTTKLWPDDHGYENAKAAFAKSLGLLGLDYVDLYLIHWPGIYNGKASEAPARRAQTWKALEELYSQGKCKSIGVSNYTITHMEQLLRDCKVKPVANQVEFHPRLYQKELLSYCQKNEVVLQAYSPLGKGALLSDSKIKEIAKSYNKSAAQLLVRWAVQKNCVVLPKSGSEERMKENSEIDFEISAKDMEQLDGMNANEHVTWDPTNVL
jgi:diketogulonate reductase-like aldo/keto reductase